MSQDPNHPESSTHHVSSEFSEFARETDVVEETVENGKKVRRRGIYLLPNLFTTTALFSGFFAVVAAINGDFAEAAIAVFVSMVLDGLDGDRKSVV